MPYLLSTLSKGMVKQRLTEHTRLDSSTVEGLLNTWVHVPSSTPKLFAIATFVDPLFTGSNTGLQITRAAFPKQFKNLFVTTQNRSDYR
jgi:hypothetical protein